MDSGGTARCPDLDAVVRTPGGISLSDNHKDGAMKIGDEVCKKEVVCFVRRKNRGWEPATLGVFYSRAEAAAHLDHLRAFDPVGVASGEIYTECRITVGRPSSRARV